jgi:hypothetical protein
VKVTPKHQNTHSKHKIHVIDHHLCLQAPALQGNPYTYVPLKLSPTHSDPYRSKVNIAYQQTNVSSNAKSSRKHQLKFVQLYFSRSPHHDHAVGQMMSPGLYLPEFFWSTCKLPLPHFLDPWVSAHEHYI